MIEESPGVIAVLNYIANPVRFLTFGSSPHSSLSYFLGLSLYMADMEEVVDNDIYRIVEVVWFNDGASKRGHEKNDDDF